MPQIALYHVTLGITLTSSLESFHTSHGMGMAAEAIPAGTTCYCPSACRCQPTATELGQAGFDNFFNGMEEQHVTQMRRDLGGQCVNHELAARLSRVAQAWSGTWHTHQQHWEPCPAFPWQPPSPAASNFCKHTFVGWNKRSANLTPTRR